MAARDFRAANLRPVRRYPPCVDIGIADSEIALYEGGLRNIKGRIDVAAGLLSKPLHPLYLEFSALLLRQVLELIVLASFAANRRAVEAISSQLDQKKYDEARSWQKGRTLNTGLFRAGKSKSRQEATTCSRSGPGPT